MVCRRDETAVPECAALVLAPDRDLKALARVRVQDVLDEILTLEDEQHRADALEILKLGVAEELCRAAEVEAALRAHGA